MNTVIKRAWNKNKLVKVEDLTGMTFQAENGGHTFEISGVDDTGAAVSLSGTVEARFLRADNAEIIISGTVSSGKASVTLSAACYAIPGRFLLTIYVTSGGQKVAVYAATGSVVATSGTAGGSIPPLVTDSIIAGDATVNGVLDVTNRRTNAVSLSAPGWYRAICVNIDSNAVNSFSIDITIGKTYAASSNEIHTITLLAVNNNFSFVNEASSGNALDIQGIRYTRVTGGAGYVDIKYSTSNANDLYVDFNVRCKPGNEAYFIPESLQSVADSPSGETIRAQYTFSKSTNADYTFSNVFGKTWYFRKRNGVVYVDAPDAMTPTTNGLNTIGTLPDEFKPNYSARLPVANNSGKDKWLYISTAGAVTAFCYTNAGTSTPFSVTASYLAMN